MSFLKRIINIPKESPDFNEEDLLKCLKYFVLVNNPFFISRLHEWRQGYKNLLHLKCKDNETKPTQGGNWTLSIYSIAYMFGAHGNQLNNLESQINLWIQVDVCNSSQFYGAGDWARSNLIAFQQHLDALISLAGLIMDRKRGRNTVTTRQGRLGENWMMQARWEPLTEWRDIYANMFLRAHWGYICK